MSTRRRIAAIALALTAPLALSACGTSFGAQTNQQYQAGVGANLRTGPVQVYNGLFVDNGNDTFTFSGGLLSDAEQSIESVTVDGEPATVAAPIALTADALSTLGAEGEIIARSSTISAGDYVTVVFSSSPAGEIAIDVPVVARTALYDGVAKRSTAPAAADAAAEADAAGE